MKEILFRGKRLDNGEWVDGHLYTQVYHPDTIEEEWYLFIKPIGSESWVSYRVDTSTVGQYTGLNDKNDKRIFDGDIVRCGTGRICKVTFFTSPGFSGFDLVPIGGFDAPPPHRWSLFSDTEVIGNITDNPELLGK